MSFESTAPTRMNLLARRSQIKLASDGAGMLKSKREALLKELIERAKVLRSLREELHRAGRSSLTAMALARAVRGTPEVRSAALAGHRRLDVQVKEEPVWGLPLAEVETQNIVRQPSQRNMGNLDASAHLTEAGSAAEHLLERLIACAPVEANLRMLGEEVKKVSRRINALEEHLLPQLRADVRRIAGVLDEREREDRFRLRRIKSKHAARERAAREAG